MSSLRLTDNGVKECRYLVIDMDLGISAVSQFSSLRGLSLVEYSKKHLHQGQMILDLDSCEYSIYSRGRWWVFDFSESVSR
jgi:hypothetical protein